MCAAYAGRACDGCEFIDQHPSGCTNRPGLLAYIHAQRSNYATDFVEEVRGELCYNSGSHRLSTQELPIDARSCEHLWFGAVDWRGRARALLCRCGVRRLPDLSDPQLSRPD